MQFLRGAEVITTLLDATHKTEPTSFLHHLWQQKIVYSYEIVDYTLSN